GVANCDETINSEHYDDPARHYLGNLRKGLGASVLVLTIQRAHRTRACKCLQRIRPRDRFGSIFSLVSMKLKKINHEIKIVKENS
ncbi:hypothetical protein MAR_031954, partial [Mya arenaria]